MNSVTGKNLIVVDAWGRNSGIGQAERNLVQALNSITGEIKTAKRRVADFGRIWIDGSPRLPAPAALAGLGDMASTKGGLKVAAPLAWAVGGILLEKFLDIMTSPATARQKVAKKHGTTESDLDERLKEINTRPGLRAQNDIAKEIALLRDKRRQTEASVIAALKQIEEAFQAKFPPLFPAGAAAQTVFPVEIWKTENPLFETNEVIGDAFTRFKKVQKQYSEKTISLTDAVQRLTTIQNELASLSDTPLVSATKSMETSFPGAEKLRRLTEAADAFSRLKTLVGVGLDELAGLDTIEQKLEKLTGTVPFLQGRLFPPGSADAIAAELGQTGAAAKQFVDSLNGLQLSDETLALLAGLGLGFAPDQPQAARNGGGGRGGGGAATVAGGRPTEAPPVNLDHLSEQLDFYRELRTLMPEAGEKYEELRRHMAALQEEQYRAIGIEQQYLDTWRTWVELREATDFSSGLIVGLQDYIGGLTAASVAQSSVQSGADAFRGGLFNVARGFQSAGDAAREFGSHILDLFTQMIIDLYVMTPLMRGLSGLFGGFGGGGLLSFLGFADGGVLNTPGLSAYRNQVVTRPTIFPFARGRAFGLMGEAGAEAIMPLARDRRGRLGVAMADDGAYVPQAGEGLVVSPVVNIQVVNQSGVPVTAAKAEESRDSTGNVNLKLIIDQVDQGLAARESRGSSRFGNALRGKSGLNPNATLHRGGGA